MTRYLVCGMQVDERTAVAKSNKDGREYHSVAGVQTTVRSTSRTLHSAADTKRKRIAFQRAEGAPLAPLHFYLE